MKMMLKLMKKITLVLGKPVFKSEYDYVFEDYGVVKLLVG